MTCNIRKKFFAELLGTFFLVFIGTGAAVVALLIFQTVDPNNVGIGLIGGFAEWIAIALAFGLTVMIGIYVFGILIAILDFNKAQRHLRGGLATKRKYQER